MNERLIFLTNDDGFDSRGMEVLIDIARRFGRVVVVAPERPQSGLTHAFTMLPPLFIRKVREEEGLEVYALSGTPVDCVKVAFDYLLRERKVDLVLSGINHGSKEASTTVPRSGCRSPTIAPTPISRRPGSGANASSATCWNTLPRCRSAST